jgi:hypothetical protein
MEGRTPQQKITDRRLSPRKMPTRLDAAELQRFTDFLNGDLLVEPPPADHFLRWTPAPPDPGPNSVDSAQDTEP